MAKKIFIKIVDDITGDVLEDGQGETIRFSINNVSYSIDLGPDNAGQFRDALAPYVEKAERQSDATRPTVTPRRSAARTDPAQLRMIRQWARANGYEVSDRGRIPAAVSEAYEASHN